MRALLLFGLLIISMVGVAQPGPGGGERSEMLRSARNAYLNTRLNITAEQSQVFWPVFNELDAKRRELRQSLNVNKGEADGPLSDDEAREIIEKRMKLRQEELNLEKEYYSRFLDILSPQQVILLFKAEEEFRRRVIRELRDRPGREGRRQERREARERRRGNGND